MSIRHTLRLALVLCWILAQVPWVLAAEDCPKAARELSVARALERNSEETEMKLREVVKLCPSLADASYYLGLSLAAREKNKEAIQAYSEAIRRKPEPRFYLALAQEYLRSGENQKAEAQYTNVLQLDSKNVKGLQGLSAVQQLTGRVDEAEETLRRALQIDSSAAELYFNLAILLHKQGRSAEAVTSLSTALDKRPHFHQAATLAATLYRELGKLERAEDAARKAVLYRPEDFQTWFVLGTVLESAGELEGAQAALLKAEALAPHRLETVLALSRILAERGELEQALSKLKKAVESHPRDSRAHAGLGWAQLRQYGLGESSALIAAEQSLKTAIQLDSENGEAHNNLGLVFELSDRPAEAKREYEEAKRRLPSSEIVSSNNLRIDAGER